MCGKIFDLNYVKNSFLTWQALQMLNRESTLCFRQKKSFVARDTKNLSWFLKRFLLLYWRLFWLTLQLKSGLWVTSNFEIGWYYFKKLPKPLADLWNSEFLLWPRKRSFDFWFVCVYWLFLGSFVFKLARG
jgi:hypothetical protein